MPYDTRRVAIPGGATTHPEELVTIAARVSARYGDAVQDFLAVPELRHKTGRRVMGSFIELARLNHRYHSALGPFHVSLDGGHRTLYQMQFAPEIKRIGFVMPNREVCCVQDSHTLVPVFHALGNWVGRFMLRAEEITAHAFVQDWERLVTGALRAGQVLVYEGEHRGETLTGEFVVTMNGSGKEISVRVPFLEPPERASSTGQLFPLSRAEPRQERILFRFLRDARPLSPPTLVKAVAKHPTLTL